jgi:hypothetical protein
METLLQDTRYGVPAGDPGTFLFVASLLTVVALAACYIPARRAASVAPMGGVAVRMTAGGSARRDLRSGNSIVQGQQIYFDSV